MLKQLLIPIAVLALLGEANAGNNPIRKARLDTRQKKYSLAENQLRIARAEAAAKTSVTGRKVTWPATTSKRGGGNNSVQAMSLVYQDLGQSVNPYTSISGGRNYVSVIPQLNTVGLIRRGGPNDFGGVTNKPGNKLFYDINFKGGSEGNWRISRGMLFDNEVYNETATTPFAARYPQGLLFNPPGNTDTSEIIVMATTRALSSSNDDWGGYGRGWRKAGPNSTLKQTLGQSGDVLHFRIESMISTSQGSVFTIEPEEQVAGNDVIFTDRILINRYKYNTTTLTFDSTTAILPFQNDGGDSASAVGNTGVAFGPDGLHGYAVITGYNKNFSRPFGNIPYFSRTSDGGETWTDFKPIDINKSSYEEGYTSPCKDKFRDSLFVGNYVVFTDTTIVQADSSTQPGAFAVDYTFMDFDVAVDKDNQAHIFGIICVGGFGDTLGLTGPGFFRPQNGSWNIHISIPTNEDVGRGTVIGRNQTVQGCWGDCGGVATEDLQELNRPQISQSADASTFALVWFDTDLDAHPQLTDDNNSNPDMWMRVVRVGADGSIFVNGENRNISKNSEKDGQFTQGSVSPVMLNTANGYEVPVTLTVLSDYVMPPGAAEWPVTHSYVSGITISPSPDSVSNPLPICILTKTNDLLSSNRSGTIGISLMPNPASSNFTAHLTGLKNGNMEIRITNLLGQVIETRTVSVGSENLNIPFNLRKAPKGIYLVNFRNGNRSTTQRIVVE